MTTPIEGTMAVTTKQARAGRVLAIMDVLLAMYGHFETAPSDRLVRAEDFERLLDERGYVIVPKEKVL